VYGEACGVVEGAVAEILHHVLTRGERCHSNPRCSLAAHLRQTADIADLLGRHGEDEAMTANAAADECRPVSSWSCCAGIRSRNTACGPRAAVHGAGG
jgi:hypothetical protein